MLPNSMEVVASDGLLLVTLHVYTPHAFTVRVWVYCAVIGSPNTVSFPSVTVMVESLVQVTVVAGPPVEIQVRVLESGSNVTPLDITIFPPKVLKRIWYNTTAKI